MEWIYVAQNRDNWQALVTVAINMRVPQKPENFLSNWGTCSIIKKDSASCTQ
jgi:hypothetical protein